MTATDVGFDGDLVLLGGVVLTGDPAAPRASAVAVRGGRVAAVGGDAVEVAAAVPPAAEVVDLEGGAVLAGFGDGHVHPLWGGVELAEAPVRDCGSVAEVVDVVRRYAAEHPDLEWVTGGGYPPALAPGGLFDAAWLDEALSDRPVVLTSADHHVAWCNSTALRRAGVSAATPDPAAGTLARRADGSPLGTLVEWSAMDLVVRLVPKPDAAAKRAGLGAATRLLAEAGVTWAQEAALAPADVEVYLAAADAGELSVRVNIALRAEPGGWPEQRAAFVAARDLAEGHPDVSVRTVKYFADGVVEAGTGWLLAPYDDAPHTCGLPVWTPAELAAAVAAFDADGFSAHVHAIGDAAVRAALDAVQHAAEVNGPRDRRAVIAHTQVVDPADLPRFAALGVIANFEPLWACPDACQTELTWPRLGSRRSALQYPMATILATGAVVSFGSDWPVSSLRPLDGLAVAVTRQTPGGTPVGGWLPQERLPVEAALAAYTSAPAYQSFEEHRRGTVAVGKRADLVWLGADPSRVPALDWPAIPVRGTWLGGRRTAAP